MIHRTYRFQFIRSYWQTLYSGVLSSRLYAWARICMYVCMYVCPLNELGSTHCDGIFTTGIDGFSTYTVT